MRSDVERSQRAIEGTSIEELYAVASVDTFFLVQCRDVCWHTASIGASLFFIALAPGHFDRQAMEPWEREYSRNCDCGSGRCVTVVTTRGVWIMRKTVLLGAALVSLSACGRSIATAIPGASRPAAEAESGARSESARGPRKLNGVPPGHYPRAGQCRLWYSGRPPGHQPRPTDCSNLAGRVPAGAFVLHNGRAWDADYDWRAQARRQPGSVPDVILEVIKRRS